MSDLLKGLFLIAPVIAMASAISASASSEDRALSLKVIEDGDIVEVQLIANSPVTQQVEYEIELIGNSTARHSGSTSIASGNVQVLSTLRTNSTASWCARAKVSEAGGAQYTLEAGDCPLI